ncbi:MAG: hypothetical protein LBV67_09265 [Streptococcaceae bacterium]|jgi:hypothetical protein|nr:hypothetical protein [Streptococcaceae bacterium]
MSNSRNAKSARSVVNQATPENSYGIISVQESSFDSLIRGILCFSTCNSNCASNG